MLNVQWENGNMFKRKKEETIQFISMIPGLEKIEECLPRPTKNFIPEWWKQLPVSPEKGPHTVRDCPSFPDYFSQGYIIPMWADTTIKYDKESDTWWSQTGMDDWVSNWGTHSNNQFTDYVTPNFQGINGNFIFKTNCPWLIKTKPGWSVMQTPLFYHFNKEYSILPGILDTDYHYQVNQQVLYHGDGKEIFIKRGEPFAQYIPFKRENMTYSTRYQTNEDLEMLAENNSWLRTKFVGQGSYRMKQRLVNKQLKNY
jgi:hypothetical protein